MTNKRLYIFFIILIFGILSCNNRTNSQQVDNTKPMYGEVTKNLLYKMSDEKFRVESIGQFKTLDSAVIMYTEIAWDYFKHNDLETAMKRFNQVWLLNPEYPDSYFGFAALMEMQKNDSEAERFYKLGLKKDIKKDRAIKCYREIAYCKQLVGDTIGSLKTCNKIIELYPNDIYTLIHRACIYQYTKHFNEAISDFNKAIALEPNNIRAYCNRGLTFFDMNNFKSAKKDLEICVKLDSTDAGLRGILGMIKLKSKDKLGACKDFRIAKQLGDTTMDALIKENCQ